MRVLLATAGTRGDVQPMLALALGLRSRGVEVPFAAPPNMAAWVRSHGLEFVPVGVDYEVFVASVGRRPLSAIPQLRREVGAQAAAGDAAMSGVDAVVAAGTFCVGASLAERHGVPYTYLAYVPQLLPSDGVPSPLVRWYGGGARFNRLTWAATSALWRVAFGRRLDAVRARWGLGPVRGPLWDHFVGAAPILAADPTLAPPPRMLRGVLHVAGAIEYLDASPLDEATEAFLAAGPPPVFAGFGSMANDTGSVAWDAILTVARRTRSRFLVAAALVPADAVVPASVHVVRAVPHARLFPRCAAVVHHGGAGTTFQAAVAGVPQVVVPHLLDQHYWAMRLDALGVSGGTVPRAPLDAARLAAAVARAIEDAGLRARAASLPARLLRDGAARTMDHLERLWAATSRGSTRRRRGP